MSKKSKGIAVSKDVFPPHVQFLDGHAYRIGFERVSPGGRRPEFCTVIAASMMDALRKLDRRERESNGGECNLVAFRVDKLDGSVLR